VLLKAAKDLKSLLSEAVGAWPLTARVPVATGLLIFIVGIAISHLSMAWIFHEQETILRRISDVYLDGVATAILPAVAAGDAAQTTAALRREFLFDEGMREFELIVQTPDGAQFARVTLPGETGAPGLDNRTVEALRRNHGFTISDDKGSAWGYRELMQDGRPVGRIYAEIDVSDFQRERWLLRTILAVFTLAASGLSALLGYVVIKHMVRPLHGMTARLQEAHRGALTPVPKAELLAATTEFGRLLRGFNTMVGAIAEREQLAASLAAREKSAVLGQLAATVAHEVRNPLGGMFNAVDTGRRFGQDAHVRNQSFDLIERGLWSIRNIVGALLASYRVPQDHRPLAPEDLDDLRILIDSEARRSRIGLRWRCNIDRSIPVDATQVRQIALNLLLNACAVSGNGNVGFAAELDGPAIRLQVEDDGPGLPDTAKVALDGGDQDGKVGLPVEGIGLGVVNRLVSELGGSIDTRQASTGKGAHITVTIPLNEAFSQHACAH
jgi:signal transduction histidine kinase